MQHFSIFLHISSSLLHIYALVREYTAFLYIQSPVTFKKQAQIHTLIIAHFFRKSKEKAVIYRALQFIQISIFSHLSNINSSKKLRLHKKSELGIYLIIHNNRCAVINILINIFCAAEGHIDTAVRAVCLIDLAAHVVASPLRVVKSYSHNRNSCPV